MFETSDDDEARPGMDPAVVVAGLLGDSAAMNGAQLIDAIADTERLLSALTAWQMRALAALAVPGVAGDPTGMARRAGRRLPGDADDPDPDGKSVAAHEAARSMAAGEVAAASRVSPVTTGMRVRNAIRMCTELPATLDALASGSIDRGKALVIAEYTAPLPGYLLGVVQGMVLPTAQTKTTAATRKAVAAAVIAVDPRGAEDRHEDEHRERTLVLQPEPDGMSTLKAYLAADAAAGIYQLADLLASQTVGLADDDRSIGARRVDALADLAGEILTHGCVDLADYLTPDSVPTPGEPDSAVASATPDGTSSHTAGAGPESTGGIAVAGLDPTADSTAAASADTSGGAAAAAAAAVAPPASNARATRRLSRQGRRPHLQVTVGLATLAGLDDLPAELAGHGAITAGMARCIATSAGSLCSLLADETTGAVIAAGAHTYRPRQDLRDQLTALVDSCRFPSCRQPVWRCDVDHRDRFDVRHPSRGGKTTLANTDPLCRRHHLFKHHTAWTLRRDTPSSADPAGLGVTWTSPTGHTYPDPPRQVAIPGTWSSPFTGHPDESGTDDAVVDRAVAAALREACRSIPEFLEHRRLKGPGLGVCTHPRCPPRDPHRRRRRRCP